MASDRDRDEFFNQRAVTLHASRSRQRVRSDLQVLRSEMRRAMQARGRRVVVNFETVSQFDVKVLGSVSSARTHAGNMESPSKSPMCPPSSERISARSNFTSASD